MYPYYQIAEPITECTDDSRRSVFTDCFMLFNTPHPDTGIQYILAKQFPTLETCTRTCKELVPDAEYIVETYLPRKNSRRSQQRWHRIPKDSGQWQMQ